MASDEGAISRTAARIAWVLGGLLAAGLVVAVVLYVAARWLYPLPFSGPWSGQVIDAETGEPIARARVRLQWTCYDSPLPDGGGMFVVGSTHITNATGRYTFTVPSGRAGFSSTMFTVHVRAPGYIEQVVILDPENRPLPPETAAWPFTETTVRTEMPPTMDFALAPATPVYLEALTSNDPVVRRTAREELEKLGHIIVDPGEDGSEPEPSRPPIAPSGP